MDERLISLFTRLIQLRSDEASDINSELDSLCSDVDGLNALFSLFRTNINKDIRTLSGCTIKKTLKTILDSLTESDLLTIKESFIVVFQFESDLDILNIIIDSASIIFNQWPEIIDFIQSLIEESSDKSNQLAMALLSKIPEEIYEESTEKYIEMCTTLVTLSLDQQTNCRAALELFSSISYLAPKSDSFNQSFPNYYMDFLELYQEYLFSNDYDCFQIASQLERSIKFIDLEKDDATTLLNFLIELGNNTNIQSLNKYSIINVIDSILEKQIIPDLLEDILQIAIECSSSLFDDYCYIENQASFVNFHFLRHFYSTENFEDVLIENLKTDSESLVFASLLALSSVLLDCSSQISDTFLTFILSSCELQNHSILEQSFSILLNVDFDLISEEMMDKIIETTLNNCMPSSDHFELQNIIIQIIAKFLFEKRISDELSDDVFSMLMGLYEQEQSNPARDKIILCFAGLIECFGSEKVDQMLPLFVPLLIESSKSFDPQCVNSQAAAVESLSVCVSNYPGYFEDVIEPFTSLLISWIKDTDDRQHIESSISSIQRLISYGIFIDPDLLDNVLQITVKILNQTDSDELDFGIDDSGITFDEIQFFCLALLRKMTKVLFSGENKTIETVFFIGFLPNLIQVLCDLVARSTEYQEDVMKTIFFICKYCYKAEENAVLAFCDFFMDVFENDIDLPLIFFRNLFNLNMEISYPEDFLQSIYSKCLEVLNEGNYQIIILFESMSNKFDNFPIEEFIDIIGSHLSQLSAEDRSNAVSVFNNYLRQSTITQENSNAIDEIMTISFDTLELCTNYSIKPSPIRFLNLLLSYSIENIDQIVTQFYPIFNKIFNNSSEPDLQTKFLNETLCESTLFLLKVIVTLPKVSFPYKLFFPRIFYFIPFTESFPANSDILVLLSNLPRSSSFSKLSPYFDDLFACLIRIISLNEDTIYRLGIETNSFSGVIKFAFEMLRAQESRIQIIKEVADEDQEKINNIQNRINYIARDPDFLQLEE